MRRFAPLLLVSALAGPIAAEPFFNSPPLDDAALEEARGGFDLDGGVRIDFGVVINTRVDGVPVLQTELQVTGNEVRMSAIGAGPTQTERGLTASAELSQTLVRHEVGERISSLIVNAADGRVIDNQLTINLRLDNVQPLAMGGTGFRVQSLGLDAALLRASGG